MPAYKLTYFDLKGRGELCRLLFAAAGVEYEDKRIEQPNWPALKDDTPFGALPILEWGKKRLCQSHVIEAFLARQFGLAGKTPYDQARAAMILECMEDMGQSVFSVFNETEEIKAAKFKKYIEEDLPVFLKRFEKLLIENGGGDGFFVGDEMTYADIGFCSSINLLCSYIGTTIPWEKYPKLNKLGRRVTRQPSIREWLDKRPVTAL